MKNQRPCFLVKSLFSCKRACCKIAGVYVIVVRWRRVVYVAREWLVSIDHEGEARVGLCKQKPRACHVNHKQSAIVQVSCMKRARVSPYLGAFCS